jgi:hypothetical protein
MPLGRDLDIAIMGGGGVLNNSTHAILMRRQGIAEFPKRVSLKIKAWRQSKQEV